MKRILIYILIGVIITFFPLLYINNKVLANDSDITWTSKRSSLNSTKPDIILPDDAKYISVSENANYVSYVKDEKLYIKDLSGNTEDNLICEELPVINAITLNDRDIVMYFIYDQSKQKLMVKTYNIDNDEKTLHKEFTVKNLLEIKDVKYSSYTNVIYINAKTGNENYATDNIYRIDIMKNVSHYFSLKDICKITLLTNEDCIAFQNKYNNLYINKRKFVYQNNSKFILIGKGKKDLLYASPYKDKSKIYVIENQKVVDTIKIDDTSYKDILSFDNRNYLIYDTYAYNVETGDKINIKNDMDIIDITEKQIIYKNNENKLFIENI